MIPRLEPPSDEVVARIRELSEQRLSDEEFQAYLDAPMTAEEHDEITSLLAWFQRRYPTPTERLAYARRAYARCMIKQSR